MRFLTDFADLAVVVPLAVAIAVALLVAGWRRGAAAWAVVVPATMLTLLAAKMLLAVTGTLPPFHGLHSPSGHTASAAVVYGGLLSLLLPMSRRSVRGVLAVLLVAGLFAMLFGGTRLALHDHTRSDVLIGALFGIAGALALALLAGPRPSGVRVVIPLAVAMVVVFMFHGRHIRAENHIDHFSHRVSHIVWKATGLRG